MNINNNNKYLIIGLSNPNKNFEYTRHNVGNLIIKKIIIKKKIKLFFKNKYGNIYKFYYNNNILFLLKSNLYMNIIGISVKYFLKKYNLKFKNLIVIYDDIYIKLGKIKLKNNSGSGGHNGIKSIQKLFKTKKFIKIKIGIGNNFKYGNQNKYVLSNFKKKELYIIYNKIYLLIYNKIINIINNNKY
ncbi:MAG: aminoacyl-tRNA hydrolase [Candidatus Shikimatogenerans bostrichidophilus]|nr:MAG: aminoacyl-tRNA hydrolase [Candidatus Shikimatogenerans bostrichidophilus]